MAAIFRSPPRRGSAEGMPTAPLCLMAAALSPEKKAQRRSFTQDMCPVCMNVFAHLGWGL